LSPREDAGQGGGGYLMSEARWHLVVAVFCLALIVVVVLMVADVAGASDGGVTVAGTWALLRDDPRGGYALLAIVGMAVLGLQELRGW